MVLVCSSLVAEPVFRLQHVHLGVLGRLFLFLLLCFVWNDEEIWVVLPSNAYKINGMKLQIELNIIIKNLKNINKTCEIVIFISCLEAKKCCYSISTILQSILKMHWIFLTKFKI